MTWTQCMEKNKKLYNNIIIGNKVQCDMDQCEVTVSTRLAGKESSLFTAHAVVFFYSYTSAIDQ